MFVLRTYSVRILTHVTTPHSEQEREANVARNRAFPEQLELKDAVAVTPQRASQAKTDTKIQSKADFTR